MAVDPAMAARIQQLRDELNLHNYRYYVLNAPTISDTAYDSMMSELRRLESQHPELVTSDSPTQRVGAPPSSGFAEVVHGQPMLSLANAFSLEELQAWHQRVQRLLGGRPFTMMCELKIDGLAINLTYRDGVLVQGATRGDGSRGEDVTANLRTIRTIPLRMMGHAPSLLEVRGEVYLSKKAFDQINAKRAELGLPLYANPRNSAAGSVRQLDPGATAERPLEIFAYAVGQAEDADLPDTQAKLLAWLRDHGFRTNPHVKHCKALDDVEAYFQHWLKARESLGYDTDGVVVKVDELAYWDELGVVGREPRYAIAYKWPAHQAVTRLLDIGINVGRTGSLNPYAILEPVFVGGVTVKNAALHNEDDIRRKDLRIGDWVIVQRAGEVIPQVVAPLTERRTGQQREFHMPNRCPICGGTLERDPEEAMVRCVNVSCPARIFEGLKHFVSKGAMDIEGLGPQWCQALLDSALVKDVADLYHLTKEQLLTLERMGDLLATKILRNIEGSKERPLHRLLFALGIFHVGSEIAELLASRFPSMDALMAASEQDLTQVPGIGPKIAASVVAFFADPPNRALVQRLRDAGVRMQAQAARVAAGSPLSGATFCFTGTLAGMERGAAEQAVKALGASATSSVTRKTTYLVVGAEPGAAKVSQAQKLGTQQLSETQFLKLLEEARQRAGNP
jgi:DNA ligase (NAD+)